MIPKNTEPEYNGEPEPGETPETDGLEQAVAREKKKAEEYLANWQRTQADFLNFKRRTEQERQDFSRNANAGLLLSLLPVLDDIERALENVPEDIAGHEWVEGTRLVERKFKNSLESIGVKQVLALGMVFDPNYHEALRQEPGPEGIVVGEFQKGYLLHDKLLRPARVIVGSGEDDSKEEA